MILKNQSRHPGGYASMAVVGTIAIVTSFGVMALFQRAVRSHDGQARAQLRLDYAQKEDALLRALVAVVPSKAIASMKAGSALNPNDKSWESIFNEAITLAGANHSVDDITLGSFGIQGLISANSGNANLSSSTLISQIRGDTAMVNSGTLISSDLLFDSRYSEKLPPPLSAPMHLMSRDDGYPIISEDKIHPPNWAGATILSPTQYPLYNLIPYPDIRFGYATPGAPFVAKRNWWAFQVTFGTDVVSLHAPSITKNYVLSIYEIPAQLPISAEAFMSVGSHANGSDWTNVTIDGGVYGGKLETSEGFTLPTGNVTARRSVDLGSGTTVQGNAVSGDFNEFGVREAFMAQSVGDLQSTSLSADSGRAAFIPINRGQAFFEYDTASETNALSTTPWNFYSSGAQRCVMKLFVTRVASAENQTPTQLRLHYQSGGSESVGILDRNSNWPQDGAPGSELIPFQTEHTETGRKALILYLERLPAFLASLGASGPAINNSLVINPDLSADPNIKPPEFPSVGTDIAVVLRESGDLSPYSGGFSLVTNLLLYFADDFNIVSVPQPAGAGLPANEPFYPPVSLYAPEKRYGTTLTDRRVDFSGQVSSLATGDADAIHPLDFKSGTFDSVSPGLITADLKPIRSPAELPPIVLMNWLVVIEEIF